MHPRLTFRTDIHALRALAVSLVVIYHSGVGGLPGGYVGVDVFFVISGFLISQLLLQELTASGRIDFVAFYGRRLRRLLPAAALVLVCTMAFAYTIYAPLALKTFSSDALATAGYVSNFWFAHLATDYLASGEPSLLLHTWSLSVEEQFYLAWPAILCAVASMGQAHQRGRLLITLALIAVTSFAAALALTTYAQPYAFFASPTRAFEFAFGAAVAVAAPQGLRLSPTLNRVGGVLGLAMIIGAAVVFSSHTPFPGLAALLPAGGAMLILACPLTQNSAFAARCAATRPVRFVGDISYSLYLWHWPVFAGLRLSGHEHSVPVTAGGLAAAVVLAALTYHLIENPFRFSKRLQQDPRLSLAVCLAIMLVVAGAAAGIRALATNALASPAQQRFTAARSDVPEAYGRGCHVDILGEEPTPCVDGAIESGRIIVLFGDSHAVHWHPAFDALARRTGRRLMTFTKSSCPSVTVNLIMPSLNRLYTECARWREAVLREINRLDPELVVLSNSQAYFDFDPARIELEWAAGLRDTLNRLATSGARVVVMRDTPDIGFDAPACLSQAAWQGRDPQRHCRYDLNAAMAAHIDRAERAEVARFDNVFRLDLADVICAQSPCPVVSDGNIMFSDDSHLTATYSNSLADEIGRRLRIAAQQD